LRAHRVNHQTLDLLAKRRWNAGAKTSTPPTAQNGTNMQQNAGLILAKRAHLSPKLEGWVDVATERRFTFEEFNRRSNLIANALLDLGVKKGDRVALLLMNSIEFMESFFAIAKIGGVCVPLNWRLVPDELSFILSDAGATVMIYGDDFEDQVRELHARGAEGSKITEWICVGEPAEFADAYASFTKRASDAEPEVGGGDDDELYIMYTSGTTGLPKGVVHTHNTAIWACFTINATADIRYGDRSLTLLPMFHVGALAPLTAGIHKGVVSVVARAFDPSQTWTLIEQEKINTMLAVPAMLNFMLQTPRKDEVEYSTLRWCMSGAAPVPVSLIEAYDAMKIEIHQVYGLTETCGPACLISPEDAITKAGSTGKAYFHTDVRVVDGEGNDVADDEIGEIIVAGRHIMKEYWNRPDATAETIRDGWLYTGDLASRDSEGFIFIQDRKKDMIISGGENVYPAEVENVILAHPNVKDVAVIGQPSEKWGESPIAVVVREDDTLAEGDVLAYCNGKVARFKQPRGAVFVDEIPRNPSGKALKRLLREQFPGPAPE
jgi:acyl-CoA synthetase (AMP-forming)/AMP-acid ligase II